MESIDQFIQEQQFSNPIYGQVFKDVATNYADETPRQSLIRKVVMIYEKRYPAEMDALAVEIKKAKELAINEYAANKDSDQRRLLKIPQSLWSRINALIQMSGDDKDFLGDNDELMWFVKSFPEFRIPEKL